jgi:hypothetical protein
VDAIFRWAAAGLLFLGLCAGPAYKVMPSYQTMSVEKSSLGIILLRNNLTIRDTADVRNYVGKGETKLVFCDFFASLLREFALKDGKFAGVEIAGGFDTSGFVNATELLAPDKPLHVKVPGIKTTLPDGPAFLLILDSVTVGREYQPGYTMTTPGVNGMTTPATGSENLVFRGTFALWDAVERKTAAIGRIEGASGVFSSMSKDTWIEVVKAVSSAIFLNKPYGKRAAASGK